MTHAARFLEFCSHGGSVALYGCPKEALWGMWPGSGSSRVNLHRWRASQVEGTTWANRKAELEGKEWWVYRNLENKSGLTWEGQRSPHSWNTQCKLSSPSLLGQKSVLHEEASWILKPTPLAWPVSFRDIKIQSPTESEILAWGRAWEMVPTSSPANFF